MRRVNGEDHDMSEAKFVLTLRTGPEEGKVFELDQETIILGRDVTNDIILSDAEVSRRHSRLSLSAQGYVLEDLGSTNGTFVNGERLSGPYLLIPGDQIGLSQKLVLSYDLVADEGVETVAVEASVEPVAEPDVEAEVKPEAAPSVDPAIEALVEELSQSEAAESAPAEGEPKEVDEPEKGKEDAPEGEKKPINRWLMVGIGCSVLVIVGSIAFWLLDKFVPNLLYAPLYSLLRLLGLQ
jgi:pSer/pThr/pTyr-binding forkhead associated (FHA) protein